MIAFFLLPSHALDYGLFESTSDEYLGAMGWSSLDITALWFLPVILYGLMPLLKLPKDTQAKAELYLLLAATLFIFVSATIVKSAWVISDCINRKFNRIGDVFLSLN